jgi:hypothetical protein
LKLKSKEFKKRKRKRKDKIWRMLKKEKAQEMRKTKVLKVEKLADLTLM